MSRKLIDLLEPRRLLAILYVDLNSPIGTNNGSSWGNAFHDLHAALTAANSGDTIRIADGTYKPTTGTDRTIAFQLKSGVSLYGGYAGHGAINPDARDITNFATVLSGEIGSSATDDNSYNVLKGNDLADLVTIDGFTVTQTWGEEYPLGGAIYVNNVNLTVRNLNAISNKNSCIRFESNPESYGKHKLQVYDSNFSLNRSGVSVESYEIDESAILVEDCTFTQNTGGGLWVSDTFYEYTSSYGPTDIVAIVRSSHFDGNGGGARIEGGAVIMDCTFNNNAGQGLYIYTGLVTNSELNNNGSDAMYFEQYATIINTDFIRNNGHAASWFKGGSFTNCRFIGNTESVLMHHDNSDSSGSGVDRCLFVGNPIGPALRTGAVTRSVFIGNGIAISIGNHMEFNPTIPVTNNTFFGNTGDIGSVVSYPDPAETGLFFSQNIAWKNGGSTDILLDLSWYHDEYGPQIVKDSIIDEGYEGGTNISTVDPQFIREPSQGADNVWGTEDDDYGDLHLQEDSPAVDWGYGAYVNLDPSVTLVGNEYVVTGTEGDDGIHVYRHDYASFVSVITFWVNDTSKTVIAEHSQSVRVNAGDGNDRVTSYDPGPFTFDGGAGNDTLKGGDVLIGGGGDDELNGYRGNETIFGGDGNDTITEGRIVDAGAGNDRIVGSDYADSIFGGAGNDYILANEGNDTVYGGDGKDTLTGSAGRDQLYGQNDADRITAGKGIDAIFGGSGEDRMYGNEGNDYIEGGGNVDRAWGGIGNDTLIGGGSNDKLYGEGGNDRFFGNAGADLINGGSGTDAAKAEDDENLYLSIESYF